MSLTFFALVALTKDLGFRTDDIGRCLLNRHEAVIALETALPSVIDEELDPDLHCLAIHKHIAHDLGSFPLPTWDELFQKAEPGAKYVKGITNFAGIFRAPYRYHIRYDADDGFHVRVKIYVSRWKLDHANPLLKLQPEQRISRQKHILDMILKDAEAAWSSDDDKIHFEFVRTEDKDKADFSISLNDDLRPTYYLKHWDWTPEEDAHATDEYIKASFGYQFDRTTFTHELGHMMGLEDEYSTPIALLTYFNKDTPQSGVIKRACDVQSIMCEDWQSPKVYRYHRYLIARRYLNSDN